MKKLIFSLMISVMMIFTMTPMFSFAYEGDTLNLTGLNEPYAGETPVTTGVTSNVGHVEKVEWLDSYGQKFSESTFKRSKTYEVKVTLTGNSEDFLAVDTIKIGDRTFGVLDDDVLEYGPTGDGWALKVNFGPTLAEGFYVDIDDSDRTAIITDNDGLFDEYELVPHGATGTVNYEIYLSDSKGSKNGSPIFTKKSAADKRAIFTPGELAENKVSPFKIVGKYYFLLCTKDEVAGDKLLFTITYQYNLAYAKIKIKDVTYNGKSGRAPNITIKALGDTLTKGKEYTLSYAKAASKRKSVGTYKFTIDGKGYYFYLEESDMDTSASFRINPKGTTLKSVKGKSKSLVVKWNKRSTKMATKRITGYRIMIATDKAFTKNVKTYKVKGYKNTSKTIKGLKKGKKYYVKVGTYMTLKSGTYKSTWSKKMSAKTK